MRNSELDSKYFVKSLDYFGIPCQNTQKPPQNCAIYLLCGFLRNWSVYFHTLRSQNRAAFTSLPFQGYCELEGPVQTTAAHGHTCLLSHKGCLSATQIQRTSSVYGHKQLPENVINETVREVGYQYGPLFNIS